MKTLIELFEDSVKKYANNPYMWEKIDGEYKSFSYKEIKDEVYAFGAGLVAMGIQKGDRIGLLAEGRTDWIVAELGMFYAGVINVPLSVKLEGGIDISFRLKHSEARMVIISFTQVQKTESILDDCPDLEKIVYLDNIDEPADYKISFKSIKEEGRKFLKNEQNRLKFENIYKSVHPDDVANISYTSGTTADPKGIMLTHNNFVENVRQSHTLMSITEKHRTLTILPWDHSFAHTACLYCFMYAGASIAGQEIGKTNMETNRNIIKNINEIKPDLMMSVPAISKSLRKNIESGIKKQGKTAQTLFNWGMKIAYSYNGNGYNRGKGFKALLWPLYKLFDQILFKKIRSNFGGNLKFFIGGGALLDTELQRFFAAVGMPVMQGYGLSEASPVISSNALHAFKFGSSGKLVKYMDMKIMDENGKELPKGVKGEMVIRGGNVMKGYWKNEAATVDTIKDGWLHTGDMGYIDDDDFLIVLGRFKSLLISNDGEKYSPEGIEEAMTDQSTFIDQCMLYNNQNPYTSAMIVPNMAAVNSELKKNGIDSKSEDGVRAAIDVIQAEINEYRKGGKYEGMFPERWLPIIFVILPDSFNEQNKLLNSTMKMVRGKVVDCYAKQLEFLYTAEAKNIYNEYNISAIKKWNE